ncbi:MAG TPA: chromosomal replication initiator protein DnaA [Candidatus Dojkabacteria bacterium]|nr:chromosomal replication initiator protein DnaA [Candidatus Dojkabacteria bacterium]
MQKAEFNSYIDTLNTPKRREMDADELWKITKEHLKLMITNRNFLAVFSDSYIEDISNGVVCISCGSAYKREKILRDYLASLKQALYKASGQNFEIEINLRESANEKRERKYEYHDPTSNESGTLFSEAEKEQNLLSKRLEESHLNPKYLFSNFIVGSSNRLAEAVAEAVVEDLGKAYNPVFFYGNTGLGKTHLMQAIGNETIRKDQSKKVAYVSIEQFLNEMVEAIRTKKNEDFRNKYRAVDLLMIDDVQFVESYPRTQEELFHTFNTLYQADKQIVLASDRPPKEIRNITDRLRTRFEGGMVVDIQIPDYETRIAIIKQLLEEKNLSMSETYIEMIAKNIENNIRELEGAVTKVASLFKLGINPTEDDVSKILQIDLDYKRKRITPSKVISVVGDVFDVKASEIKGSRRTAYIAQCRQIVMYILRKELELPLEKIAKEVNRKDHTTVIHAFEKIEKERERNKSLDEKINVCIRTLKS